MHIDRTIFAELQESAGADFVAELDRASPIAARLAERRKPRAVSYVRKPL